MIKRIERHCAVIILAAGLGKRMKSDKAKVLHEILGQPMILYVVGAAAAVAGKNVIPVIGNQAEKVREVVSAKYDVLGFAFQEKQLGTGHAVMCALPKVPQTVEHVLILCGDVPLIAADSLIGLIEDQLSKKRDLSLLSVQKEDPSGYGRILMDENMNLSAIVEEADATEEQKKIKMINAGIYCVKKDFLADSLQKIKADNAQGEFYLTDIIGIAHKERKNAGVLIAEDADEVTGINTPAELKKVEKMMRIRKEQGKMS